LAKARIENYEAQFFGALGCIQNLFKPYGFKSNIAIRANFGVGRNQIIDSANFHTMPGIIHDCPVRRFCTGRKIAQGTNQGVFSEIGQQSN
jgi:hypothetical protein